MSFFLARTLATLPALVALTVQAQVVINEINYDPADPTKVEQYIELHNTGTGPMDLTGWQFTKGVDFVFPAVTIPAGGYLVVAANVASFNAAYGSVPLIVGGWTGSLANGSMIIAAIPRCHECSAVFSRRLPSERKFLRSTPFRRSASMKNRSVAATSSFKDSCGAVIGAKVLA